MSTRRPYQSSVRSERAGETRIKIREAARHLFSTNGFVETTVADIATSAGVATQTVYAVYGTKGAIVAAILDSIEESADMTNRGAEIFASTDSREQLSLFVSWIRTLCEISAPVLRAAIKALGDPDVAAFVATGDERRMSGCVQLSTLWADRGSLRHGIKADDAAHVLWLLTGAERFLAAIDRLGWTADEYEEWLRNVLTRELFAPESNS